MIENITLLIDKVEVVLKLNIYRVTYKPRIIIYLNKRWKANFMLESRAEISLQPEMDGGNSY